MHHFRIIVVGIHQKPGAVVGAPECTEEEHRSHMSLWCLMASPLLCGNDIRSITPAVKSILLNREIIEINQDPLGKQAARIRDDGDYEVFARPLADGSWAVGLLNRSDKATEIKVPFDELGIRGSWKVRDVWKHADLGKKSGEVKALVPMHGCTVFRLSK
jgi:alpha-galactosidase